MAYKVALVCSFTTEKLKEISLSFIPRVGEVLSVDGDLYVITDVAYGLFTEQNYEEILLYVDLKTVYCRNYNVQKKKTTDKKLNINNK